MVTGGMPDARLTRACLGLRTAVLSSMTLERFRFMVGSVMSAGPAPRSPEAARHRTAGAWRTPGRGAYVYARIPRSDDGQVSRPAPRIDTQRVLQRWKCPEALEHRAGADGRCVWCTRRVAAPVPRPELGPSYHTILGDAYRYYHDPDWGSERDDT